MQVSHPNRAQGLGCCTGGDHEALVKGAQIETSVEAIAKHGKVACRALPKVERMLATRQNEFEVTADGVDPLELRYSLRRASGNDGRLMEAASRCGGSKAGQSIGEHCAFWRQMTFRQSGHRLARKARNRCQADAQRTILFRRRNGPNEGYFFLGAASYLAAEVGVIEVDFTFKQIAALAVCHHLHQLVMDQPSAWVTNVQAALQRQGRHPGVCLAEQVDRPEQVGISNSVALSTVPTMREGKSVCPANHLKRLFAQYLGSVALQKIRH